MKLPSRLGGLQGESSEWLVERDWTMTQTKKMTSALDARRDCQSGQFRVFAKSSRSRIAPAFSPALRTPAEFKPGPQGHRATGGPEEQNFHHGNLPEQREEDQRTEGLNTEPPSHRGANLPGSILVLYVDSMQAGWTAWLYIRTTHTWRSVLKDFHQTPYFVGG